MDDVTAGNSSGESFRLIYRSRNLILPEQRKTELGTLFSAARSNNKKQQICGALLVSGDWFVQVLEGDESTVRALFASIESDPRHDRVSVLETGPVASPVFARWAMAKVAEDGQPDIPLIAHVDGISPAASRGTTPDQESVLDVMRGASRDDAHAS
ncbi:MAG: BLUF domain-containing protein [Actinomycetota bacterium]